MERHPVGHPLDELQLIEAIQAGPERRPGSRVLRWLIRARADES